MMFVGFGVCLQNSKFRKFCLAMVQVVNFYSMFAVCMLCSKHTRQFWKNILKIELKNKFSTLLLKSATLCQLHNIERIKYSEITQNSLQPAAGHES
jgi:hypothetical protein